jgi:CheY-like chemotaxis protein
MEEPVETQQDHAEDPRKVVLMVEDDFQVRWLASQYLRTVGFRVIEAATANEAIAVLSSCTKVHIIFSDINLAGEVSGHDLARWMAKYYPKVPVLLTSGNEKESALVEARPMRAFHRTQLTGRRLTIRAGRVQASSHGYRAGSKTDRGVACCRRPWTHGVGQCRVGRKDGCAVGRLGPQYR